jgi:Nucleotide modification associated domain 1
MNREKLLNLHREVCTRAYSLMCRKNADYSGGNNGADPFLNFTRCESMGITSTERGFLVRLTDKMSRLSTFCDTGTFQVADEKLEDTVEDIINYSILFLAYVRSKKEAGSGSNAVAGSGSSVQCGERNEYEPVSGRSHSKQGVG